MWSPRAQQASAPTKRTATAEHQVIGRELTKIAKLAIVASEGYLIVESI
jgi:hypothetical protein